VNQQQLEAWVTQAVTNGWLEASAMESIQAVETQEAERLFIRQGQRPLLIAFFGGTGAGKSSLLNRLAGAPIARVGLERPTSYEVSLYLHQDFEGVRLPAELPLERTRIAWHQDPERRLLAWIDMPDMDSTALENRALVEAWLPYIDWLVYVVTPERYQDDLGWRFLQARSDKHAWLFVMNHWDQAQTSQLDDFRQRLRTQGFAEPQILRTACTSPPVEDDFAQLEAQINAAIRRRGLDWLQQQGLRAREAELCRLAEGFDQALGSEAAWGQYQQQAMAELNAWIEGFGQQLHQDAKWQISQLIKKDGGPSNAELDDLRLEIEPLATALASPRIQDRLAEPGLRLPNLGHGLDLPIKPLQVQIPSPQDWHKRLQHHLEQGLETAIAQPGTPLQRTLRQGCTLLGWLLPLLAGAWVAWELVQGYYLASKGQQDYQGINFAIHSLLLLGLAWALPWLGGRLLKPRPRQVMQEGITRGLKAFGQLYLESHQGIWAGLQQDREGLQQALQQLMKERS
jgi:hypothetical protein